MEVVHGDFRKGCSTWVRVKFERAFDMGSTPFFTFADGSAKTVRCTLCGWTNSANITRMKRHLAVEHPPEENEAPEEVRKRKACE